MRRTIKQRGETYARYRPGLERFLDGVIHNPRNRRRWARKAASGGYRRALHALFRTQRLLRRPDHGDLQPYYIGQSHLDAAWLWTVVDSKIKAYKTFYQGLEHIDQFPFFTLAQTSPQYFDWIRCYDPALWERVKQAVAAGHLEPVGGMWVEPDLNVPSGESLVRQRLYGMLFFERHFGKMPWVESLLDVFGFPQSVPQILVKSGARAFWTTKCTWSDTNPWPIANYWWQSQDGSRIFTHHFKFNIMAILDIARYKRMARFPRPEWVGRALTSANTNAEIEAHFDDDYLKTLGIFYGLGDGGKGPLELEIMLFQAVAELGRGKHTSQHRYFERIMREVGDRMVVWDDEMYLETHRGCLTSHVAVKTLNRRAECWAGVAEALDTQAALGTGTFDKTAYFEHWRKILFNQFHDILPGTSIQDVYPLAEHEQQLAATFFRGRAQAVVDAIPRGAGEVVVYNPSNWERAGVPGLGYLRRQAGSGLDAGEVTCKREKLVSGRAAVVLGNAHLRLTVDEDTREVTSIYSHDLGRELIPAGTRGPGVRVHKEPMLSKAARPYKAWNIDGYYYLFPVPVKCTCVATAAVDSEDPIGPGGQAIVLDYAFERSTAQVRYSLYPGDPFVRVQIQLNLRDPKRLVKFFVPIPCASMAVTSDTPYGTVVRQRAPRSEMERGKWEFSMQKWIDVSDPDYGVAVLNDSRYGASAHRRGIYVTLARTPVYPTDALQNKTLKIPPRQRQKYLDLGDHAMGLRIYPHAGDWRTGRVWQHAHDFNAPLIHSTTHRPGSGPSPPIPLGESFLALSAPNVWVAAIKPPECPAGTPVEHEDWTWDGRTFVARLVEMEGRETDAVLRLSAPHALAQVAEVDLLERQPSPLVPQGNGQVALRFQPHEIKTLLVTLT